MSFVKMSINSYRITTLPHEKEVSNRLIDFKHKEVNNKSDD